MLKAKDTIIKDFNIETNPENLTWAQVLRKGALTVSVTPLLEKQAEISFKAGIREVVDFFNKHITSITHDSIANKIVSRDYSVFDKELQAQLKVWEVEDANTGTD